MPINLSSISSSALDGASGFSGTSGASGTSGTSGTSGASGTSGTSGTSGASGTSGTSGAAGPSTTINATNDSTNAVQYPVFVATNGSNQTARVSTSNLVFNPNTGHIGLGTTNPSLLKMQILGGIDNSGLGIQQSGAAFNSVGSFYTVFRLIYNGYSKNIGGTGVVRDSTLLPVGVLSLGDSLTFSNAGTGGTAGGAANETIRFIVDTSGNVGIGKASPQATLDWRDTVNVISANTTAVGSKTYIFTASLVLTLPASPTAGDWVKISNQSGTTTCVIGRNAQNIMSLAEDMTVDSTNASFNLVFTDATRGWVVI